MNHLFLEGKWFYNYCLGSLPQNKDYYNWFKEIKKSKTVKIKPKDQFEERELKYLSSQMKEAIAQEILNNLKSLKQRKDNGKKIGKLKFTSKERPITLKQFNMLNTPLLKRESPYFNEERKSKYEDTDGIINNKSSPEFCQWQKRDRGLDQPSTDYG